MKYLKIIGLLVIVSAAMTAVSTNASAAKLTSPTGTEYGIGKTFKATAGTTKWTGVFVTVECATSTIEGKITASGGAAVEISLSTLDFNTCNFTTTVKKAGTLKIDPIGAGTELAGTLTSIGAEIEIATSVGTCAFSTGGTDLGTFTGGKTATMDIDSTTARTGGHFLCGSTATWEGSYSVVTPDELWLDS